MLFGFNTHCLLAVKLYLIWDLIMACLPVELIVHTATGVIHASQSRGVSKLLLHTAPLLFTQISHDIGSELGYADVEHSNKVIWWTNGLFVWLNESIEEINVFIEDKNQLKLFNYSNQSLISPIYHIPFLCKKCFVANYVMFVL